MITTTTKRQRQPQHQQQQRQQQQRQEEEEQQQQQLSSFIELAKKICEFKNSHFGKFFQKTHFSRPGSYYCSMYTF